MVALSTTDVEYMETTHASKEAIWLQRLCSNVGFVEEVVRIDCDRQSVTCLEKNPTYNAMMKYIDVLSHFLRHD
jgi:hypothetical protein